MTADVDYLQELIERVKLEIKMSVSAIIIQRAYREYIKRNLDKFKNRCAQRLQMQWRVYRLRCNRDRIKEHRRHITSTMIQKYMKGFPVAQKFEEVYIKMRLHDNIDYFQKMRSEQLRTEAQIKIAAVWRGYSLRKKMVKPAKEEPKAVKEKNYKSRVGPYIDGKLKTVGKYPSGATKSSAGKKASQGGT